MMKMITIREVIKIMVVRMMIEDGDGDDDDGCTGASPWLIKCAPIKQL